MTMTKRYCFCLVILVLVSLVPHRSQASDISFTHFKDLLDGASARIELVLGSAALALLSTSDMLAAAPELEPRVIHAALRRYSERAVGTRAIILIDANGELVNDSFMFPSLRRDLSDREYFKKAMSSDPNLVIIGEYVEAGRTSGAPFIPMAIRIPDAGVIFGTSEADPARASVAAAIINVGDLVPKSPCDYCMFILSRFDGSLLGGSPGADAVFPFLTPHIHSNRYGEKEVKIGDLPARMIWRSFDEYELSLIGLTYRY